VGYASVWVRMPKSRGGNESDADGIVLFPYPFHIFITNTDANTDIVEYICRADVIRIRIQIGCFLNMKWI
jgi:hypothetical protein